MIVIDYSKLNAIYLYRDKGDLWDQTRNHGAKPQRTPYRSNNEEEKLKQRINILKGKIKELNEEYNSTTIRFETKKQVVKFVVIFLLRISVALGY